MKKKFYLLALVGGLISCSQEEPSIVNSDVSYLISGSTEISGFCVVCSYSPRQGKDVFMITAATKGDWGWKAEDAWTWNNDMLENEVCFAAFSPSAGRPGIVGVEDETFCMPIGSGVFDMLSLDTSKGNRADIHAAYCRIGKPGDLVVLDFKPILSRFDFSLDMKSDNVSVVKTQLRVSDKYPIAGDYKFATGQWTNLRYCSENYLWNVDDGDSLCLIPCGNGILYFDVLVEYLDGSSIKKEVRLPAWNTPGGRVKINAAIASSEVEVICMPWREVHQVFNL